MRLPSPRHRSPGVAFPLLLLLACTPAPPPTPAPVPPASRRAILISFDALNERRARETISPAVIPAFHALFDRGACASHAVPAWPSKTAASHASLWTGAYGNTNGIAANWQPPLPRDLHRITELVSGYAAQRLRTEPLWITAALAGWTVVAHHPTQAPAAPGYPPVDSAEPADSLLAARATRALALPSLAVVNGYNATLEPDRVITADTVRPTPAAGWKNLARLGSGVPPLEIAWLVGRDSVFGLLYGEREYSAVLGAPKRDVAVGVRADRHPADRDDAGSRPLARFYSEPMALGGPAGASLLYLRLFELAPDASSFRLFLPAIPVVEANSERAAAEYVSAVGGWIGNGARWPLTSGGFGATLDSGGEGEAEWRYVESLELLTRQFMRGSDWAWRDRRAELLIDYFPVIDEVDHMWYGHVAPETPGTNPRFTKRLADLRQRAWQLADRRLKHLMSLVESDSGAALFVSGDHGMRPTWRVFRPNAALRSAGLLAVDDSGRIVASRTSVLAPDGLYLTLNRTAWKDGVVGPDREEQVLRQAEEALRSVRGEDGSPVVTSIWRVPPGDSLGRGGPTGGDLYFETAAGYAWSRSPVGPAAAASRIGADHGFPSISPDMRTVLCVYGPSVAAGRRGPARTIDAAGWVRQWLGDRP